ncbi:MAG: DsrE/DsrF/DrsH-like family protein [Acidimicrobiia bacterium]|nr:DsrE/DsrF/DrsH-like family protein [Acidimicrobiia bacterium]
MSTKDQNGTRRLALVASKGALDEAYPPLILAATAASLGWEVGIYFTFYGLDILHKDKHKKLKVSPIGNPAAPVTVPTLVGALPGMTKASTRMMKKWLDESNLPGIPEFLDMARDNDVKLFACSTTMGVMGVEESDLIEGCDVAGAAAFLDFAADADVQMFI